MIDAPELNKKVTMSWYALMSIVFVTAIVVGTATKVLDNDDQRASDYTALNEKIRKLEEFILAEIGGHRSDCDRRFNEVILPRIQDLESNHKVYKIE